MLCGIDSMIRRIVSRENGWQFSGGDYAFSTNLLYKDGTAGEISLFRESGSVRLADSL